MPAHRTPHAFERRGNGAYHDGPDRPDLKSWSMPFELGWRGEDMTGGKMVWYPSGRGHDDTIIIQAK